MKSRAEGISRQLHGWADSLQNCAIAGQRYLNEKTRRADKGRREREEFLTKLAQFQRGDLKMEG